MIYSTKEGSHFWDYVARCNSTARTVVVKQTPKNDEPKETKVLKEKPVNKHESELTENVETAPQETRRNTKNSICAKLQSGGSLLERMRQAKLRRAIDEK